MKIYTFLYTLCLLVAVSLLPAQLRAQSFQLPASGTTSYTTCSGTLYDDGGPNHAYALDIKGSVTLFPGAADSKLRLEFTVLELDSLYANLAIYDGPDTSYPKIGKFSHGLPTVYATGGSGALTVVLTASGGLPLRGFAATIGCVTSAPPPDLAVQDLQLMRASALAGEFVWSTARITNLSGTQAAATLRYFLSTDTKLSPDDQSLYATDLAVTTGSWIPAERYVTIPDGTAPGAYYLLCVARLTWDPSTEINTANNVTYAPLTVVRPTPNVDLVARYGYYSSNYQQVAVTNLSTSVEVQNRGQASCVTSQVGYYLSADAVFSPDDTFLDYSPAKAIAAGTYIMVYGSASIPATTPPGTYYLLCVVDYLDEVIEDEEQNNTLALRLVIPPLTTDVGFGDNYTLATTQPAPGGSVSVTCTLRNKGTIPLDLATVGFYLSADRLLSADDVLLDHASSGKLWPDNSYYGFISRTLTLPATTPLGKHYLLLAADYRNELAERNEQDNVLPLALDVVVPAVDMTIGALTYNGIYAPVAGDVVANRLTISNQGTTQAYPVVVVGYYLSADDQLGPNDLPIGQVTLEPLAGGESRVIDIANRYNGPVLPPTTVSGAYYLLAVADHLQQVAETNETNNVMAMPIQVKRPDIDLHLPHNFSVLPASTAAGTSVKVDYNLGNLGTTSAYAPSLGFYLSTDTQFGPDDILIGSDELYSDIYPAYYTHTTRNVAIPRNVPSGRYYLLGVADYLNEFAETDETNNVRYAALEITAARPDLIIQARPYLSPRQVVAGSVVTTESYVNNIGAGPASASAVGYYLSADPVLSPNDVLLGSTVASAVQTGYSAIVTGTFTVPAGTASGRYYVLFIADYQNQVDDGDRSNNSTYTTISIAGQPLATREQTAGYELRVGPVPAPLGAPVSVQLSGPGARAEASLGLYSSLGQLLTTQGLRLMPGQSNQVALPTTGLAAGVYILHLTGPGLNAVRRVVVE